MFTIALASACLAYAGHGRSTQLASEVLASKSDHVRQQETGIDLVHANCFREKASDAKLRTESSGGRVLTPLKAVASLLSAFNGPIAGWQVTGFPVNHHCGVAPLHQIAPTRAILRKHQLTQSLPEGLPPRLPLRTADISWSMEMESLNLWQKIKRQWVESCEDLKRRPFSYITIPIVAACVGYITNWVGVKMLFFPVHWTGIPLVRYPEQPFGWLGWQGIVPAKRYKMADTMVDVTITKLLNVGQIFKRLDPRQMARLLEPDVRSKVLGGFCPPFITRFFLGRSCRAVINRAPDVVDIRSLVVSGLATDSTTLSNFFQNVGRKELKFLIDSGFGVGFVLGLVQMLFWMIYPKVWTFPLVGSIVGYITNWVALKWIFEPLNPTRIGPFVLQGMFLKRQKEVAEEFSEYIAHVTLCSKRVWADVLDGQTTPLFSKICGSQLPLPGGQVRGIVSHLKTIIGSGEAHPLHDYTDATLGLRRTLERKMKRMSTAEFEQVLHPIFQEDELTLIMAGAVLGAAAGALQWWQNDKIDGWINSLQVKFDNWRTRSFGQKDVSNSTSLSNSTSPATSA